MNGHAAFIAALLDPSVDVPSHLVHPQRDKDAAARFAVYRNNVVFSLKQNLRDGFPLLLALLGDETFDALADAYVRAHPPRSPLMFAYGDTLADFVTDFAPLGDVPYAADVARLDYACREVAHARDHEAAQDLALEDAETQSLQLASALCVLRSDYALFDLWAFLADATDEVAPPADVCLAQSVMIYRLPDYTVQMVELSGGGADFVTALQTGASLAHAAEGLDEENMTTLLSIILQAGLVTAIK